MDHMFFLNDQLCVSIEKAFISGEEKDSSDISTLFIKISTLFIKILILLTLNNFMIIR